MFVGVGVGRWSGVEWHGDWIFQITGRVCAGEDDAKFVLNAAASAPIREEEAW